MLENDSMHRRALRHLVLAAMVAFANQSAWALDDPVNMHAVGQWDEYQGVYCDVWADGDYAYVPNWGLADGNSARVHVIDISAPSAPFLAHTINVPNPNRFASPQDVKSGDGLLLIALEGDGNDGVAIADIRDPLTATVKATIRIPGYQDVHNLFYEGGYLYLTGGSSRDVAVVDLTTFDPDNPPGSTITQAKWLINNIGSSTIHDITVNNDRLFVAAWNSGMWVYDVADVANTAPTFLGSTPGSATHSMWSTDDGKFVVVGEERSLGGIMVYEITDNGASLSFTLRDSIPSPPNVFSVHNQVIIGYRLYNSWYEQGTWVYDIDPATGQLEFVGSFDTSSGGLGNWGVYPFLGDNRILATDGATGLWILGIGDPPPPDLLPAPGPMDYEKNRYISFVPTLGQNIAIEVRLQSEPAGLVGWVGPPDEEGVARVVDQPHFSNSWPGVLHVGDCEVIPGAVYEVRSTLNEVDFSNPLSINTSRYGDAVGVFDEDLQTWTPPQGVVNFVDISAAISGFQDSIIAPHRSRVDIGDEVPNWIINFTDISLIINGFQDNSYPPNSWNAATPFECP